MTYARFPRRRGSRGEGPRSQQRSLRVEPLESRLVLAGSGLVISELMAANSATLADGDGSYSDWIELHNPTAEQSISATIS